MAKQTLIQLEKESENEFSNISSFVSCYLLLLIFFIAIIIIENRKTENFYKMEENRDGFLSNNALSTKLAILTEADKEKIEIKKIYQALINKVIPFQNILPIAEDDEHINPHLLTKVTFHFDEIFDQEKSQYPSHKSQIMIEDLAKIQKKFSNYPVFINISYFLQDIENDKNITFPKLPYLITQFLRNGVGKEFITFDLESANKNTIEIEFSFDQ